MRCWPPSPNTATSRPAPPTHHALLELLELGSQALHRRSQAVDALLVDSISLGVPAPSLLRWEVEGEGEGQADGRSGMAACEPLRQPTQLCPTAQHCASLPLPNHDARGHQQTHLQVGCVRHIVQRVLLPNAVLLQKGKDVGGVGQAVSLQVWGQ